MKELLPNIIVNKVFGNLAFSRHSDLFKANCHLHLTIISNWIWIQKLLFSYSNSDLKRDGFKILIMSIVPVSPLPPISVYANPTD